MGIRFRFTKNKKKDLLRYLVAGSFFLLIVIIFWNQSSTPLRGLSFGYQGYIVEGRYKERILNEEGVVLLKTWLEERTRPALNPLTILRQHRLKKQNTDSYDFAIGMQPVSEEASFREYGVYQKGHTIYLQVEPVGIDRVFKASFTIRELELALEPYIEGDYPSQHTTGQ